MPEFASNRNQGVFIGEKTCKSDNLCRRRLAFHGDQLFFVHHRLRYPGLRQNRSAQRDARKVLDRIDLPGNHVLPSGIRPGDFQTVVAPEKERLNSCLIRANSLPFAAMLSWSLRARLSQYFKKNALEFLQSLYKKSPFLTQILYGMILYCT